MTPSALERHDLEQDVDELRTSIETLEASRGRLRDLIPSGNERPSGSVWSDLTEIVSDFFEAAGETINESDDDDDDDDDDSAAGKVAKKAKKAVTTDWSKALGAAFGRLRDRLSADLTGGGGAAAPVAELGGVLGELDSELARLNADLQKKLERIAELDQSIGDAEPVTPVRPNDDVTGDERTVVVTPDDDYVDVIPVPVDVLPDIDPMPVVVPDDDSDDVVIPTPPPDVDVDPVVIPVDPDVITPVVDVTVTDDDDTPAYDPGQQTEIGELDGAIYDVNEILAGGRTVADLRRYDVPAGVVRDAGVTASAMLDGGYTVAELHEAGVPPADLHGLAGAADLRAGGYTAADLHGVFSVAECVQAFSPHELREAGFDVSDFRGLVSAADLRDVFSIAELRTVYSVADLRGAGYDAADLSGAGVDWGELASAGFTMAELQHAGASDATLKQLFPSEFSDGDDDDDSR
jgi:hypothetical protein